MHTEKILLIQHSSIHHTWLGRDGSERSTVQLARSYITGYKPKLNQTYRHTYTMDKWHTHSCLNETTRSLGTFLLAQHTKSRTIKILSHLLFLLCELVQIFYSELSTLELTCHWPYLLLCCFFFFKVFLLVLKINLGLINCPSSDIY